MKQQWYAAAQQLSTLNFSALWPGFHPYPYTLYSQQEVCMGDRTLPWDSRFVGNTAITFEGQPLVIWNLESDPVSQPAQLAANLVHEMFHAFQDAQGESRYPDELMLLQYPVSPENMSLRFREFQLLADVNCDDPLAAFQTLCALRLQRETLAGAIISQEFRAETIEGMAEFIGMQALKQLDATAYKTAMQVHIQKLCTVSAALLDIRRSSYSSGVLLLHLALRAGIPITHTIGAEIAPVFSILQQRSGITDPAQVLISGQESQPWRRLYEDRTQQRKQILRAFLHRNPQPTTGRFHLCGYDPMNLWQLGNNLYSNTFFELQDETGGKIRLFGESVLTLSAGNAVSAYYHRDKI